MGGRARASIGRALRDSGICFPFAPWPLKAPPFAPCSSVTCALPLCSCPSPPAPLFLPLRSCPSLPVPLFLPQLPCPSLPAPQACDSLPPVPLVPLPRTLVPPHSSLPANPPPALTRPPPAAPAPAPPLPTLPLVQRCGRAPWFLITRDVPLVGSCRHMADRGPSEARGPSAHIFRSAGSDAATSDVPRMETSAQNAPTAHGGLCADGGPGTDTALSAHNGAGTDSGPGAHTASSAEIAPSDLNGGTTDSGQSSHEASSAHPDQSAEIAPSALYGVSTDSGPSPQNGFSTDRAPGARNGAGTDAGPIGQNGSVADRGPGADDPREWRFEPELEWPEDVRAYFEGAFGADRFREMSRRLWWVPGVPLLVVCHSCSSLLHATLGCGL